MNVHHLQVELIRLITDIRDEELLEGIKQFISDKKAKPAENGISEEAFWEVIAQLDWNAKTDKGILEPAITYLSAFPKEVILNFYDLLSKKLHLLDGEKYALHSVAEGEHFSADLFLYARCAVVANGKAFYNKVLQEPKRFPKDLYFEVLLNLPFEAYERRENSPLNYAPKFVYETGFNVEGWGEKAIRL
jgi:hypothetical protein